MGQRLLKLGALVAGTLAAIAMTRYMATPVAPSYAPDTVQCHAIDAQDAPSGCVAIDPARFGFAALRGM
ncbi:hypothetical protein [Caballeronia sp. J97]|uniref:hypothetical protein n=1 Tax=Caballeronia sp. J97 TaxID=2805429 RepID=UPI002AB07EA9|nr:hypothetical protein [Caballeronia sp. J97]